jgi:hypothetical protein
MINNMVMGSKLGLMEQNTKEATSKVKSMVMAFLTSLIIPDMRENSI